MRTNTFKMQCCIQVEMTWHLLKVILSALVLKTNLLKNQELYFLRVCRREVLILIRGLKKLRDYSNKNDQDRIEEILPNYRSTELVILYRLNNLGQLEN